MSSSYTADPFSPEAVMGKRHHKSRFKTLIRRKATDIAVFTGIFLGTLGMGSGLGESGEFGGPGEALAQAPTILEDIKITASDGSTGDRFGWTVAISENIALVGAWNDDTPAGQNAGSAYLYRRVGASWVEEAHLFASDGAPDDGFGWQVALEGNIAVVCAKKDATPAGSEAGSVYLYRFNGAGWVEETHLFASEGAAFDEFGASASLSGNVLLVGAPNHDTGGGKSPNAGSAYIYRFNGAGWVEEARLFASDSAAQDHFGLSVGLSGNVAVVGAFSDDTPGGVDAGSVYIFRHNGLSWVEEAHLFASEGAAGDWFGVSVATDGNAALIGARHDNTDGVTNTGSAFVFRFNGKFWPEEAHLIAADAAGGDEYGISVDISGNLALVGSRRDNTAGGVDAGSAYAYRFNGQSWVEQARLFASDGAAGDEFGLSLSLGDQALIVGAWGDNAAGGSRTGSVYVMSIDCNSNDILDLVDIANGTSPDVNASATPDECDCLADIIPANAAGPPGNGVVNLDDFVQLLSDFGQSTPPGAPLLPGDINYSGAVNLDDLVSLLGAMGPCP